MYFAEQMCRYENQHIRLSSRWDEDQFCWCKLFKFRDRAEGLCHQAGGVCICNKNTKVWLYCQLSLFMLYIVFPMFWSKFFHINFIVYVLIYILGSTKTVLPWVSEMSWPMLFTLPGRCIHYPDTLLYGSKIKHLIRKIRSFNYL